MLKFSSRLRFLARFYPIRFLLFKKFFRRPATNRGSDGDIFLPFSGLRSVEVGGFPIAGGLPKMGFFLFRVFTRVTRRGWGSATVPRGPGSRRGPPVAVRGPAAVDQPLPSAVRVQFAAFVRAPQYFWFA